MIRKTICIKDYQDRTSTGDTWGVLTGLTDDGDIIYYTGQTIDMSTSYDNYLGKGNRTNLIDYTQSGSVFYHYAHLGQFFLDGSFGIPYYEYLIGPTDGSWFKFDFRIRKLIQEVTLWQDMQGTHGYWQWQASNDDLNWVNIGNEFILGVTDPTIDPVNQRRKQVITELSGNTNAYRYYKCYALPGGYGNSGPYLVEMEFKIDNNKNNPATLASIPILLTQNIDDIGFYTALDILWAKNTAYYSGETVVYENNSYLCKSGHTSGNYFDESYWNITPIGEMSDYTVTYTGETQINQFRRYSKKDTDIDLYNPVTNSGFTQQITTSNGMIMQLIGERTKTNGFDYQNLYDYKFWVSGNTGTTITYSDIDSISSKISYDTKGLTTGNTIDVPSVKLDYLIGVVNPPKINIDVFIDRGSNSSFDRHVKLGEIKSLNDLESYSNGYYKIKED